MSVRNQIQQMIEIVPDQDLPVLLEVIRRFVPADPEDMETAEDTAAHMLAMEEYRKGETFAHENIEWD